MGKRDAACIYARPAGAVIWFSLKKSLAKRPLFLILILCLYRRLRCEAHLWTQEKIYTRSNHYRVSVIYQRLNAFLLSITCRKFAVASDSKAKLNFSAWHDSSELGKDVRGIDLPRSSRNPFFIDKGGKLLFSHKPIIFRHRPCYKVWKCKGYIIIIKPQNAVEGLGLCDD